MQTTETWKYIHGERIVMTETLASLSAEQWATPSWCEGWSVQDTAGHIVAAAEQTPMHFYKELAQARFKFNVFTDRGAKRLSEVGPVELVRRLGARTTTTNHPPAPVMAMLGEIIAHGQDIRRPLGLAHDPPEAAVVAVADAWKNSNILIGAKRRVDGLHLRATDTGWTHGEGPEVSGPLLSLTLAMSGRKAAHADLSGDGLQLLATRP
ncbi:MAG TPA: maleylpyruvate isomerase family mycothiol-dependent enzyme [Acidimicrobiales bacterium]